MKKIFPQKAMLAVMAFALASGAALAADLPHYKAPPPPPLPPPPLWTGFYIGLNAGGTWANSNSTNLTSAGVFLNPALAPPAALFASSSAAGATGSFGSGSNGGFIGGGQIGYNWQFMGNFVAGIEADIQGVAGSNPNNSGATVVPVGPSAGGGFIWAPGTVIATGVQTTKRLDYLGTVRGRLGWLFTPTLLLYGTGGLAYGGVQSTTSIFQINNNTTFFPANQIGPAFSNGSFSDTRVGWTAGGGLEWMFWPNWSAKVEYLYYDLGNTSYSLAPMITVAAAGGEFPGPFAATFTNVTARNRGNIVRAGLNYHFNWGAPPVVAKY